MKNIAILFMFVGFASADFSGFKTKLSLTLTDGTFGNLQSAFAPRLSLGGRQGPINYSASIDAPTDWTEAEAIINSPKSLNLENAIIDVMDSGWSLKSRAELTQGKYDYPKGRGIYVAVEAHNEDSTTYGWFSGHACIEEAPKALKIGGKKIIPLDYDSKVMVEPRYNFDEGPDLCLGYERYDTQAYLTVAAQDQNIKVVHNVNDSNRLSAKVGRTGFVSASLVNDSDMGRTRVMVTSDSVDVELKTRDGWMAGFRLSDSLTSEPAVRF
eukprot:CAMPEP_0178921502 /NCGR_PEP_ID=MMETSP0786-20121207/15599_1 /TAXON_ID=186022 /ORGANISM="Thalassionema frauenfeldii, Strain CCMP 1798" /LENGTH=268 /DNA_ID=CAMNT_0020595693 /DNA_START=97 /DNA_END=900 /DNA_ORIENTATION=-